jgi:putative ABC transport system permease protein
LSPYRPGKGSENIDLYAGFYRRVIERLRQLPGVVQVGATNNLPFTRTSERRNQSTIGIRGESEEQRRVRGNSVIADATPGFFEALGIPLLDGRTFTEADTAVRPRAVMVSVRTAERLFPGRSALGQAIRLEYLSGSADPWGKVVGVVGNVKHAAAEDSLGLELYFPNTQYPMSTARVVVRVSGDAAAMQSPVLSAVAEVAPDTAVSELRTMDDVMAATLWQQRLWGSVLAAFAILALILSGVGLYGVVNFTVRQRTKEIGIRIALGARPGQIVASTALKGLLLAAMGSAGGLVLAAASGRWMQGLLFGIQSHDVATFAIVLALLALVALIASIAPACRAAVVDPLVALRNE